MNCNILLMRENLTTGSYVNDDDNTTACELTKLHGRYVIREKFNNSNNSSGGAIKQGGGGAGRTHRGGSAISQRECRDFISP